MDINIDDLYNILKQNQSDVIEAMGHKKKAVVVTSYPLALVAEKTKVSKRREKVVVQSKSEGSDDEDISDLKKITVLLAKAFNRKKYYAKPTNNNLRTSSASSSANKKPEYEGHFAKDCKKAKVKDYNYYKTKMLLAKKDSDEQVLLTEDQAWMESSSDSDQEINANMVFMAKMKKAKELRPSLYDERVIGLGYTLMFLTHSNEALEIERFKRSRENKIEFAYDYGNLNASYVNKKIKFSDDYFQNIINPNFNKINSLFQQTSSLKPYVPTVILKNIIIDLEDEVVSLLEKEKENLEITESLKSKGFASSENAISESKNQSENDYQEVEKAYKTSCASNNVENKTKRKRHLDTLSSVRRPKHSGVIWKKKWSSNTSNVDLSFIIDSGCSKHMTGNLALLTNFVEKFFGTVRFDNNDFAVIVGCGDVVIGSMMIKKVYYVKFLRHNLFSVERFCDKVLEVAFQKSTCFVRNEDDVDLLTDDRSSNLYTIALNEITSNYSACLLTKASSLQSWLWNQRLSHLNFAIINNHVKNNLVREYRFTVIQRVLLQSRAIRIHIDATWAHVADTCAHVADTWHATWRTRPRPDPDPAQVQALTAYQPPLTGGPVVVNGCPAAVNGGSPPATVVDRHRRPSLTSTDAATWRRLAANDLCTRYCAGGGWTNGRMTRHHRYCSISSEKSVRGVSTRFRKSVRGSETQYKVQKFSTSLKKKSILEAEVAQDDCGSRILQLPMMRYEE
nr:copia protein [Tanacetum cinerariifolium]